MDVIKDMDGCDKGYGWIGKRIWMDVINDMNGCDEGYGWM